MNGAQELLHTGRCCRGALQAGRSPDRWRQDVQQQTTRVKALPQCCHWLASVAEVRVTLQDQPLLGNCLPLLTDKTEHSSTQPVPQPRSLPAPQRTRQPQAASDEICPPSKRRFARRLADDSKPADVDQPEQPTAQSTRLKQADTDFCSAREPLRLPSKASANLLQSLAEQPDSTKPLSKPACEPEPRDSSSKIPTPKRFTPIPPPPRIAKPPRHVCLDVTEQKRWRQQLAQKVVQKADGCLRSKFRNLDFSESTTRKRSPSPSLVKLLNALKQETPIDPWLCSLGTTAPLDLLTDLAMPPTIPNHRETAVKSDVKSGSQVRSLPTREPGRRDRKFVQETTPPRPAIVPWESSQSQVQEDLSSDRTLSDRTFQTRTDKPRIPAELEQIAPPAVAPTLPPLLPSQTGEHLPSVTTPLIQQQAKQEAIPPADLDNLASQIKRILDEEARRYGINV